MLLRGRLRDRDVAVRLRVDDAGDLQIVERWRALLTIDRRVILEIFTDLSWLLELLLTTDHRLMMRRRRRHKRVLAELLLKLQHREVGAMHEE